MAVTKLARGAAARTSKFSEAEWQTRVDLAACYRLVHHYRWTSQVYNHITARIPGTEEILINPYGLAYDEVLPSNLVKIDLEGNKLDDNPYPVNHAGYVIHSAIHMARPDLHCVLHTHSENATALSCTEAGFIPLTQEGCIFFERVATHEYEGIALDLDERERLIADLGPTNHTMLLYNHGLLVCADSVGRAFSRLFHFERAAGVQLKAMASGAKLKKLSKKVMRHTRAQFESDDARAGATTSLPEWPAHLRQLDRLDPDWRH